MKLAFMAGVHYSTGEIQCAWCSSFWSGEDDAEDIAEILAGSWIHLYRKNEDYSDAYRFSEVLELKCFETTSEGESFMEEQSIWFLL